MEIILLENIKNLVKIGDLVNVKRGYGRNFLIKYGKALIASKSNIDLVNKKKDELNQKNLEQKKDAKKIFDIINNSRCKFVKKSKENGELYGSVRPAELSKNLSDLKKVEIKPSQIDIAKEIIKIGTYEAQINLHAEVQAKIHIEVVEEDKQKS